MAYRADSATELRVDHGSLLASRMRADGTLLVEGYAGKEGILEYRRDGRIVRELVPASTLAASAGGLARLAVTLEHPPEGVYVTPENVERYGVGDTDGDVEVEEGGYVRVKMAVRRKDAITAVRNGTRELSPLYDVTMDWTPGTHPVHGRYDGIQTSRTYNSLALTKRGRTGRDVAIRTDASDCLTFVERRADAAPGVPMHQHWLPILLALGLTARYDSDDQAAAAVDAELRKRADSAKTALATETARADSEKARADKAEAELVKLQAAETKRADAAERTALEQLAKSVNVDPAKHADAKDLRRAIATAHLGELRADADDAYIRAVCDIAAKGNQPGAGRQAGSDVWVQDRTTGTTSGTQGNGGAGRADSQPRRSSRDRYYDSLGIGKDRGQTQSGGGR